MTKLGSTWSMQKPARVLFQPLQEISDLVHDVGALLVVDAVTSFAGVPLKVDEWKIDAINTGSQKCLSAPPGLSPVRFSEAAVKSLENRKTKVQSWFLDFSMVKNYWVGAKRAYHHTAPVASVFALNEALNLVFQEGLETVGPGIKKYTNTSNLT